jgi:hypothetical protein
LAASRRPVFAASAAPIRGIGKGKRQLGYLDTRQVVGRDLLNRQTIGDCVSHGFAAARDQLACSQIVAGLPQRWVAPCATEVSYALSRVECGRGRINGDGSVGAWMADAFTKYGSLSRLKYGRHDLTEYDGNRARDWGRSGCPDELEPPARDLLIQTASLITTYEDAVDALYQKFTIPVCSSFGFSSRRDQLGFARREGSWRHCMAFLAVDDDPKNPGLLCQNSWGVWNDGPKRHDQPDGSFWVRPEDADRMLREGDSYALSGFLGYPALDQWSQFASF